MRSRSAEPSVRLDCPIEISRLQWLPILAAVAFDFQLPWVSRFICSQEHTLFICTPSTDNGFYRLSNGDSNYLLHLRETQIQNDIDDEEPFPDKRST
jgi:hypothetical protein